MESTFCSVCRSISFVTIDLVRCINKPRKIIFTHDVLMKIICCKIMVKKIRMQTCIYRRLTECRLINRGGILFTNRAWDPKINIVVWWKSSVGFVSWFTHQMRLEAEWLVRRKMINFDVKHLIPDQSGKERGRVLLISIEFCGRKKCNQPTGQC